MAVVTSRDTRDVFADVNMTPLIDVLLVLIVMLIITAPVSTHAVKMNLPTNIGLSVNPVRNVLAIEASGALSWNGERTDRAGLRASLDRSAAMAVAPELHLRPDPTSRYERVDEVLAMTKRAKIMRMGFVGNEAYQQF